MPGVVSFDFFCIISAFSSLFLPHCFPRSFTFYPHLYNSTNS